MGDSIWRPRRNIGSERERRREVAMGMRHLLIILLMCAALRAEDWPQFRGPGGQGISDAKNLPTKWSASENVIWKKEIPGKGWSSPVLMGGKIYLTGALEENGIPISLRAICVDAASGDI